MTLSSFIAEPADSNYPHLARKRTATQLIVDGKPFLILGGELHNSSASSPAYMEPLWPKLAALNLNTVLAPVSWELMEPEEGKFDFGQLDGILEGARRNNLHLVLLWFGSW
ncbi:MAG: beta-galactosidase, partial [Acidobacteriaceae bacterium]|nr:beta-galactosidase [Acidobacteriaceae bacterium]